jgi:hypothetical protein
MTRRIPAAVALATSMPVCLLLAISCGSRASTAPPAIEFTTIPEAAGGGPTTLAPVAGRVKAAASNQRIVIFARSGAVWWVQPFRSRPFTEIARDGTWKNSIHLGTEYAALLVDADYRPPGTTESLPERGGGVSAVVRVAGSGTFVPPAAKTVSFGGYEWEVRQQPNERRGLNDYDARNVWIDDKGHLHLLLSERDGRWTSADVRLTRSLGYGTYLFEIRDAVDFDPAVEFSLYTWDALGSDQNYREMTIEVSRSGDSANTNGQYAVQPETVPANVFRFEFPAGLVTHSFRWEPGRVLFKTVKQSRSGRGDAIVAERLFTARVPAAGAETAHMTLLYDRRAARPPTKNVEVVVEKFAFLP